MSEEARFTNRLIDEKSPYLLQHAHNPVDWFPWGKEAFEEAERRDVPIFLSIGYATCHWCHVMEREAFSDEEIAKRMNEEFVCVKVDREELPEIDSLYMEFAQTLLAGAAGWPLNIVLTPDLKPFFGATYLPSYNDGEMMGMDDLIVRIHSTWSSGDRKQLLDQAERIVEAYKENIHLRGETLPSESLLHASGQVLFQVADPVWGGLDGAPKFPVGYQMNYFIRLSHYLNESRPQFIAERTLDRMQRGGIHDHLGGGFARYAVDEQWMIPHFEKMLGDNALLLDAYCEGWEVTGEPWFRQIGEGCIRYLTTQLKGKEGGFCSAEDADTGEVEGAYYTWTVEEIEQALSRQDEVALCCDFYEVTEEGNFDGRNVLHTPLSEQEYAGQKGLEPIELKVRLQEIRRQLLRAREGRVAPLVDDKVIAGWNGLAIHALARAGGAFEDPFALKAALEAAQFIRSQLWREGVLSRMWRDGQVSGLGTLDDYAALIRAALTLYELGNGLDWLQWAEELQDVLDDRFKVEGGAYQQADRLEKYLIIRKANFADGAEPSGNALETENLLRLHQLTGRAHYLAEAEEVLMASEQSLIRYPLGYCYQLMNLLRYYDKNRATVVIVLNEEKENFEAIGRYLCKIYSPHRAIRWMLPDEPPATDFPLHEGKTTVYVCREGKVEEAQVKLPEIFLNLKQI